MENFRPQGDKNREAENEQIETRSTGVVVIEGEHDRENIKNPFEEEIVMLENEVNQFLSKKYGISNVDILKTDYDSIRKSLDSVTDKVLFDDESELHKKVYEQINLLRKRARERIDNYMATLFALEMSSAPNQDHIYEIIDNAILEKQSNCQDDMTQVMLERLQNPIIRDQLLKLIFLSKKYNTSVSSDKLNQQLVFEQYNKDIFDVGNNTPIEFSAEMPYASTDDGVRENIPIFFDPPRADGMLYGDFQKNIVVTHEKGHTIRKIIGIGAEKFFQRCLDYSKIDVTEEEYENRMKFIREHGTSSEGEMTQEDMQKAIIEYLQMPVEIIERMSQLKNYFGIRGAEVFTKSHLDYARLHYVEDVKINNHMREFFEAITPETESTFLEVINNAGI